MSNKNLQKVEGHEYLRRDPKSNALINTNKSDYIRAKESANAKKLARDKIDNIENELSELKNEMSEIKNLLQNINTHLKGE